MNNKKNMKVLYKILIRNSHPLTGILLQTHDISKNENDLTKSKNNNNPH